MNERNTLQFPCQSFYKSWILKVYLLKYNEHEIIEDLVLNSIIEKCLEELEINCISKEFDYYRIGLAFIHFGQRGVEVSIWHVGKWGQTIEFYCCTWYCYNRDFERIELLDNAEPHFSQYEIKLLVKAFSILSDICLSSNSKQEFEGLFIKNFS